MSHPPSPQVRPDVTEIRRHLVSRVAAHARLAEYDVATDRPLEELGLSSRDAVAIAGELEAWLGVTLPPTIVWDHPTIEALAHRLAEHTSTSGGPHTPPHTAPTPATARPADDRDEPVAVVGIGCRLPGQVTSPTRLWELLLSGEDAVREVPVERWDAFDDGSPEVAALLDRTPRHAGILDDIAGFDTEFFQIAPREAEAVDPQHRLLLEVAWEALEHAGIAPARLRGSRTGVFVGLSGSEYAHLTTRDLTRIEGWTATGAAASIAANRISYTLDLTGPSLAVDTACSSSLTAVHLAARSLRARGSDTALAGGVNLLLSPAVTLAFQRAGGTAPDGRCKTFDAAADGMVRAEGCGVVVLKRLSDARRDGDRVLAVIRGSALNSDGRSNGLTAPSPAAQEALLRDACADAGVDPWDIDYVEAHGTGTLLGDPIEAHALGRVLGRGRPDDRPLLLGSVKTNLGHLEAAAGVAGLIKTVLALHHRTIPASLHFQSPNPHIDFTGGRLHVVDRATPWPPVGRPARAGVSSFGFGGTNAHLVLEEPPPTPAPPTPPRPVGTFPLSDTDGTRLRDQADQLARWLDTDDGVDADHGELAHTLARRHGRGRHRAAVVARDRAELTSGLRALAAGHPAQHVAHGTAETDRPGPVWVFSGYGAQWPGMGRRLLAEEPAFAAAVADLDPLLRATAGVELHATLEVGTPVSGVEQVQPVLYGMHLALARLWRSYGVEPAGVLGHSLGEVAAAVVSGGLTPEQGAEVVAHRSRLLATLTGAGAMAAVELSAAEVVELRADYPDVHVAVVAAPGQTVVAGDTAQVRALTERVAERGLLARLVTADGAGHSPSVDPLLDDLTARLAGVHGTVPTVAFYSTSATDPRAVPAFDAAYWAANLRQPVQFVAAVAAAAADGHRTFTELSPHPVLGHALTDTLHAHGATDALVTPTLRRDGDDTVTFHTQLAALHAAGLPVPTDRLCPPARILDLPPAPWRHTHHWWSSTPPAPTPRRDTTRPAVADLLVGLDWSPAPLPEPTAAPPVDAAPEPRRWLVLAADGDPDATRVAARLAADGEARVTTLPFPTPDGTAPVVAAARLDANPTGVVLLAPRNGGAADGPRRAEQSLLATVELLRALLDPARASAPRLWVVTHGAQAKSDGAAPDPDTAWLRSLVRTLAFEHPELRATLVDLDPADPDAATTLRHELHAGGRDDEVTWRTGTRYAARLVPTPDTITTPPTTTSGAAGPDSHDGGAVRPGAAYIVTGGCGGLGLEVARWLAHNGAGRLVLNGRSGPSADTEPVLERLRAAGTEVVIVTGDVGAAETACRLVAAAGPDDLRGVVHAAAVLDDRLVAEVGPDDVHRVWRGKAWGAWHLHRATLNLDLDFWAVFSSAAALLGSPGQAAYATANAWTDALVGLRRAIGFPAVAINWGPWGEAGGATTNLVLDPITTAEGLEVLAALLRADRPTTGVIRLAPHRVNRMFPEVGRIPFFTPLLGAALRDVEAPEPVLDTAALRATDPDKARRIVTEHVHARITGVLGLDPDRLDTGTPLTELGLDSLLAVRFRSVIEHDCGVALPAALLLRGADLAAVAATLATELGIPEPEPDPAPGSPAAPSPVATPADPTPPTGRVPARDAAERLALRVLRDVLGADDLGVTDDFFHRGGSSTDATTAATLLGEEYGQRFDPDELFAIPTAEGVAAALRRHDDGAPLPLLRPLREHGEGTPFYCAHPAGGTTGVYRGLARLLDPGPPFYGLERIAAPLDVAARAARYVELVRERQPEGPYRLGGWSFGGVLAYETAQRLTALGEHVELVALIDSGLPLPVPPEHTEAELLTDRFLRFVAHLRSTYGLDVVLDRAELAGLDEDRQYALVMARARAAGLADTLSPAILRHQQTSHEDTRALERYRPEPYPGRVVLYRCTDPTPWAVPDPRYDHQDQARGWDALCRDLEIVPVPGHHLSLLDPPGVHVIAGHLSGLLAPPTARDGSSDPFHVARPAD